MRRIKILFFWLFVNKNNISFTELMRFLVKPKLAGIAARFVTDMQAGDYYRVSFRNIARPLFWPKSFGTHRLNQVICETFDKEDWHYYQKAHTEIEDGEILLDIGTAEGLFPLTVAETCSHIYMVEPSRIFYDTLKQTFAGLEDKTTIFNVAVGNEDGEIPFDENSLDGKVASAGDQNAYTIAINKIDTLIGDKKITYLKADIEGFEQEMLRGAGNVIKANKPKIAITTYHTQNDPQEIIDIVKGFVPEYKHYVKGIYEETPKPVMIHFWI